LLFSTPVFRVYSVEVKSNSTIFSPMIADKKVLATLLSLIMYLNTVSYIGLAITMTLKLIFAKILFILDFSTIFKKYFEFSFFCRLLFQFPQCCLQIAANGRRFGATAAYTASSAGYFHSCSHDIFSGVTTPHSQNRSLYAALLCFVIFSLFLLSLNLLFR